MPSGVIGEYYVLSELMRKGFRAYPSINPREPGYDIVVIKEINSCISEVKIQVKTLDWASQNNKTIQGDFDGDYDILIIVLLHFYRKKPYTLLIIPKSNVRKKNDVERFVLLCPNQNHLLFKNKTMTLTQYKNKGIRSNINRLYKNQWNNITTM